MKLKFLLATTLATLSLTTVKGEESPKLVHTANGPVQGILNKSRNPSVRFISYLGLRYAEPAQRFEPAKPLTQKWSTPIAANIPGSICIQPNANGSDDCLFLNVHVPNSALKDDGTPAKQLPVMQWIHGGGFTRGEGHTYGPEYFMENEDIILVTVNYRLGALGFITFENDSTFTSNNGLRDLVISLKWVQQNIGSFGGNPEKVTIFGESAGSAAVHYLLMSPQTIGLYHAAIMQSGSFAFWSHAQNPENNAKQLAKLLQCPNTEVAYEIRKCLEKVSTDKLLKAQSAVARHWPSKHPMVPFIPTANEPRDNAFFSGPLSSFFTSSDRIQSYPNKVPVLIGACRDEGSTAFTAFVLAGNDQLRRLNADWNKLAPKAFFYEDFIPKHKLTEVSTKLREYYYGNQPISRDNLDPLIRLYTDSLIFLPVFQAAQDMAQGGMQVWPFIFSYYGTNGAMDKVGAKRIPGKIGHGDDIQYLFPHPVFGQPLENSDDENLSKELVRFWTSFAANGVPSKQWNEEYSLQWNPISIKNKARPRFDILEIDKNPQVFRSYDIHSRLEFWKEFFKSHSPEKAEL